MKLLIIEDEEDMLNALKKGFAKRGYAVDTATDGEEGLYLFQVNNYDVIVLDLNLPKIDGMEVLKRIRRNNLEQKIIILSARNMVSDKIEGLDEGANDYLTKPFDFAELDARVRALIRRDFTQNNTEIKFGECVLNTSSKKIICNGRTVELQPKEYAIVEYLAEHKEMVISSEELIEHVWDSEVDLFTVSVKVHISNIRKKFAKYTKKEVIETVRGYGYRIL